MGLKEKVEDLKLLIKNERKIWFIGGFLLLCMLIVLATPGGNSKPRKPKENKPAAPEASGVDMSEMYKDLLLSMQQDMKEIQTKTDKHSQSITRFSGDLEKNKQDTAKIFEGILKENETLSTKVEELDEKLKSKDVTPVAMRDESKPDASPGDLTPFVIEENNIPEPPKPPKRPKFTFISPGDAVPVMLLSGVNAPVDGTPYPVVFKLNGQIEGPDGSALDLGEARILSAAQGSEVDGRVLFRLTSISLRQKDGRRSVVDVDGWVVGEDGIRGMKGRLIDKLPETILAIATAGTLSAGAKTMLRNKNGNNNVTFNNTRPQESGINVNSVAMEDSLGKGLNDATQKLVDVIIERHEKLIPVVEVLAGREAVAVFSQPVEVSICEENCDAESAYSSLD